MYIYISFQSRNNLMSFYKLLKTYTNASIVNTPHSISTSCSLSIKVEYRYLSLIKELIVKTKINNLIGIFVVRKQPTYEQVERIG